MNCAFFSQMPGITIVGIAPATLGTAMSERVELSRNDCAGTCGGLSRMRLGGRHVHRITLDKEQRGERTAERNDRRFKTRLVRNPDFFPARVLNPDLAGGA